MEERREERREEGRKEVGSKGKVFKMLQNTIVLFKLVEGWKGHQRKRSIRPVYSFIILRCLRSVIIFAVISMLLVSLINWI